MNRQTERSCGILLHPTCLPGRYGIGSLGEEARGFVDFLGNLQYLFRLFLGYDDDPRIVAGDDVFRPDDNPTD
jgi:hypothetical protein